MSSMRAFLLGLVALLSCAGQCRAIKLKFNQEECMTYAVRMYEPIHGSFVSMPDDRGAQTQYNLLVTSPAGAHVHSIQYQTEGKFHIIPYESGRYKFCLAVSKQRRSPRYMVTGEVMWDLHVGHIDFSASHAEEGDLKSVWHAVDQVDTQLQQLRTTQTYLYWRERSHRKTIESTNNRVLWFAILRACTLVAVAVAQVMGHVYMFSKK